VEEMFSDDGHLAAFGCAGAFGEEAGVDGWVVWGEERHQRAVGEFAGTQITGKNRDSGSGDDGQTDGDSQP
jgi:hypothetical protein